MNRKTYWWTDIMSKDVPYEYWGNERSLSCHGHLWRYRVSLQRKKRFQQIIGLND